MSNLTSEVIDEMLLCYRENLFSSLDRIPEVYNCNNEQMEIVYSDIEKAIRTSIEPKKSKIYPYIEQNYAYSTLSYILYMLYIEEVTKYYNLKFKLEVKDYYYKNKVKILSDWVEIIRKVGYDSTIELNFPIETIESILLVQWNINVKTINDEIINQDRKMRLYYFLSQYFKNIDEPYQVVRTIDNDLVKKRCGVITKNSCSRMGTEVCATGCHVVDYSIVAIPTKENRNGITMTYGGR